MNRILLFAAVLSVSLVAFSCQSVDSPPDRVPLDYVSARLYDFMDIFELNAGVDPTLDNFYASVAIEPLALGGGTYDSEKLGMDGRLFGQWREKRTEIAFIVDSLLTYKKTPHRGNRYLFDDLYAPLSSTEGETYLPFKEWGLSHRLYDTERHPLDITAEAYLFFIGLDVGVSPQELLDFVAGIFTYDGICDDDYVNPRGWNRAAVTKTEGGGEASELTIVLPEPPEKAGAAGVAKAEEAPPKPEYTMLTMESAPAGTKIEEPSGAAAAQAPQREMLITMESVPQRTLQRAAAKPEGAMLLTMKSGPEKESEMAPSAAPLASEMIVTMESVPPKTSPELVLTMESGPRKAAGGATGAAAAPAKKAPELVLTMESAAAKKAAATGTAGKTAMKTAAAGTAGSTEAKPAGTATAVLSPKEIKKEYNKKYQQTKFRDPDQLFALAKWCEAHDMKKQSLRHLRQTLAVDPDSTEARRMLGYVRKNGKWVYAPKEAGTEVILTLSTD